MAEPAVAYVLKGYPRMSELFIASEIWRLEQLGVPLRLFVVKPADESVHHRVVDRIAAVPEHLPPTTPLSGQPLLPWLWQNAGAYRPALLRAARRHPLRLARAAGAAAAQSLRSRTRRKPRTVYVKEFLQAVELADRVLVHGDIGRLHAHFAHGTTTVAWLASILTGLPFSFTGHAKDIYREELNPAALLARKLRAAQFVVTCTAANREHLLGIVPDADVHLVYHGLNADFAELLTDPASASGCSGDRLRLAAVGRLVAKKGFDVLVEAVALLRDGGLDVSLTIAGEDGPAGTAVRRLITDRGLDDIVRMVGPLHQRELLELYRASDVFALACRILDDGDRDGIPNVMVEAMGAGLPVVSTAVSGIPELVREGHNGLLVPPEHPAALAAALRRLAGDRGLRQRLAHAARITVAEEFDGDVLAARMAGLFVGPSRRSWSGRPLPPAETSVRPRSATAGARR